MNQFAKRQLELMLKERADYISYLELCLLNMRFGYSKPLPYVSREAVEPLMK